MSNFLDNYEDVAARIRRFWATHPSGKIHTSIMDINIEKGYVLIECRVYKEFEDHEPSGIDFAFGNINTYNTNMKRWFIEDTTTSAIGRCLGLVLGSETRPTLENMKQVENTEAKIANSSVIDVDLWATNFGEIPSYKTAAEAEQAGAPSLGSSIDEIKDKLGGVLISEAPMCAHGHMIWKHGDKNGRAWGGYMCSEKSKSNQCTPVWYTLSSDGQWKPQL